jgi:NAD(P)-dependent dehydrogenase (short-subunit alcohol dehydrogenase family)
VTPGLDRYFGLAGRTVLLTGATRGIGLAMTEAFVDAGARLVIASNEAPECLKLGEELRARGVEALAVPTDVRSAEELRRLADAAVQRFGAIDVLVCNAGVSGPVGPMAEVDDAAYAQTFDVNLRHAFILCGTCCTAHGGARRREHYRHLEHRGIAGQRPYWFICIDQSSVGATRTKFGRGIRAARRAGQCHRPGSDPDQLGERCLEQSPSKRGAPGPNSAAPHRGTLGGSGRSAVSRGSRQRFCNGSNTGRGRRHGDFRRQLEKSDDFLLILTTIDVLSGRTGIGVILTTRYGCYPRRVVAKCCPATPVIAPR